MNSCPYCAQTQTHKDEYGYCKKHNCFEVSGNKNKYLELKKELSNLIFIPKCKRNSLDGTYYNPREIERQWIFKKITDLFGYIPLDCL